MRKFATEELARTDSAAPTSASLHSREFELLSLCARTIVDSETREKIRLYREPGIDWNFSE
jgi:hypothetical protein